MKAKRFTEEQIIVVLKKLNWKDKCSMCQQPLRVQGDGGIVIWTDSKHYHLWCLLDRLAFGSPLPPRAPADGVSHWGLQP